MPLQEASATPTVRDSLVSAMETVIPEKPAETTPAPASETAAPAAEAKPQETEQQKADRLRDEKGRFVEGKVEKKEEKQAAPEAPAAPPKPRAPRPSSWKKDYETHWDGLAPELQTYITQREKEYQTGVSTYKSQADKANEILQAMEPFSPYLQQYNVAPAKWLTELGNAHHVLALGSEQDKVHQVLGILQRYNVNGQALLALLSGQQPQWAQPSQVQTQVPQKPGLTLQEVEVAVQKKLLEAQAQTQYEAFTNAKDEQGQSKYPHFAEVKETMAGLLQAGLAEDYAGAYEAALRHPRHANIYEAMQRQQAEQKTLAEAEAKKKEATRARSQAVSVKSSTPTATMAQSDTGKKSLRAMLEEATEKVTTGRV